MNSISRRSITVIAVTLAVVFGAISSYSSKNEKQVKPSYRVQTGYTRLWFQTRGWAAANGATIRFKVWRSSDNTFLFDNSTTGFIPNAWELGGLVTSGSYSLSKIYYYDVDSTASANYDKMRFLRVAADGTTILNESGDLPISSWTNQNYRFMSTTKSDMNLGQDYWSITNFKDFTGITSLKTCSDHGSVPDLLLAYESLAYSTQALKDAALKASSYSTEYDYDPDNDGTPDNPYGNEYSYTTNTSTVDLLSKIQYMVRVYDQANSGSVYSVYW